MVSSASAVEEAALKNGLSLKSKMAQEDESQTGSVKNGTSTSLIHYQRFYSTYMEHSCIAHLDLVCLAEELPV